MNNELVLHPDGSNIIYITCFSQLIPLFFGLELFACNVCVCICYDINNKLI
jgi:hypothetical protein